MKKPEINQISCGNTLKILEITGLPDAIVPKHFSTSEAVVAIMEGSAIIDIEDREYLLKATDSLLIPARQQHSLLILTKLKALIIMPFDSQIEFTGTTINSFKL